MIVAGRSMLLDKRRMLRITRALCALAWVGLAGARTLGVDTARAAEPAAAQSVTTQPATAPPAASRPETTEPATSQPARAQAASAEEQADLQAEGERLFREGKAAYEAKKYKRAANRFRRAAKIYDRIPDKVESAAWMYGWLGNCYAELKRDKQAARAFQGCVQRFTILKHDEGLARNSCNLGAALFRLKDFNEAVVHFDAAAAAFERIDKPLDAAWMYGWLGACHKERLAWDAAESAYRQSLRLMQNVRGPEHEEVARCMNDLAVLLLAKGNNAEAEPLHREALEMRRRLLGAEHLDVSSSLNNLSAALHYKGDYAGAELLCRKALEIERKVFGDEHLAVASTLNNLALLLSMKGDHAGAKLIYLEALAIYHKVHGDDHPSVALTLSNLALLLHDTGDYLGAEEYCRDALAMRHKLLGDMHPDVATSLNNLAGLLQDKGDYASAETHFREALLIYRKAHGEVHSDVATTLANLALLLHDTGDYLGAEEYCRDALAMRHKLLGNMHPDVAHSLNNLAALLCHTGDYAEAELRYREALATFRKSYSDEHPTVATCLNNLAWLLSANGDHVAAEPLYREALEKFRRVLGDDHPVIASNLNNLAVLLQEKNDYATAEPHFRDAVAISRRAGTPHQHYYATGLALLLSTQRRYDEAEPLLDEAIGEIERLRGKAKSLGEAEQGRLFEHLKRFGTYDLMVRVQIALERPDRALNYLERGRARSLLDLLERSRFDPLEEAEREARRQNDQARLTEIADVRAQLDKTNQQVSMLEHRETALRNLKPFDEAAEKQRQADIDELVAKDLPAARKAYAEASRAWFALVAEYLPEGKAQEPATIQALLQGDQRMLVYSITDNAGLLLVVPPAGGAIRAYELTWPGEREGEPGPAVTDKTLTEAVDAYLAAILAEGGAVQRSAAEQALAKARADDDEAKIRATEEALNELDEALRTGLGGVPRFDDPAALRERMEEGSRLFAALMPPEVWDEIQSAPLAYVIPHGALNRLPFETLIVEPGETAAARRYWLDAGPALAYAPSGSYLRWSRERHQQQAAKRSKALYDAVALGDPIFSREEGDSGEPLPETGVPVLSVEHGSKAAAGGLQHSDVIISYDGEPVGDADQLAKRIKAVEKQQRAGERDQHALVALRIWRSGRFETLWVTGGRRLGIAASVEEPSAALEKIAAGRFDPAVMTVERSNLLTRFGGLEPLPGTRREVLALYKTLTGREYSPNGEASRGEASSGTSSSTVSVLLDESATRGRLKLEAGRARRLHLATHALTLETDHASFSSLALTVPPRFSPGGDNGFLRLIDLLTDWRGHLRDCRLVVLSACETQRGRLLRDEGVYALPWGFQFAGAPTVIASLWRVNDASTAVLMKDMYVRLEGIGCPKAPSQLSAFTEARKVLRETHPSPYFWAPFIYVGWPE